MLSSLAASTRPWPARISLPLVASTGLVKPKRQPGARRRYPGGDIIRAPMRRSDGIGDVDRDVVSRMHARVAADLRLALSMMTDDDRSAHELLDAKREINEFERAAARDDIARLGDAGPAALAASTLSVLA